MAVLAILYDLNNFNCKSLYNSKRILAIYFTSVINSNNFIIIASYYPPLIDYNPFLIELDIILNSVQTNYPSPPIILGGDFNAHVGSLNNNLNYLNLGSFSKNRDSLKNTTDNRGEKLVEMLVSHEVTLVNYLITPRITLTFTYMCKTASSLTVPSGSVIDLIWCTPLDFDIFKDFYVLNLATNSDHLPVALALSTFHPSEITKSYSILLWDDSKKNMYNAIMEQKSEVGNLQGSVSALNLNLTNTITAAATQSGMLKTFSTNRRNQIKPWFDKDCKKMKSLVENELILCKATNFASPNLLSYTNMKRQFKNLTKAKKKEIR